MNTLMPRMRGRLRRWYQRGQGLAEYSLILALVAIVILLILTYVGSVVQVNLYSKIGSGMINAGGG